MEGGGGVNMSPLLYKTILNPCFVQEGHVLQLTPYSLMHGRIKGPRPLVNPMQSDKTFITWVIKILHGNGAPKATNLRLATRMSLPAATIIMQCTDCSCVSDQVKVAWVAKATKLDSKLHS